MKAYACKNLLKCGCCYNKTINNNKKSARQKAKLEIKKEMVLSFNELGRNSTKVKIKV